MYYLAKNHYSTPTSVGFANTWHVEIYPTKKARDNELKRCPNLATRAIKRAQVNLYGGLRSKNND